MQSVSARWRSLGSKYSKADGATEELQWEMARNTIMCLSQVLQAAGVSDDTKALLEFCFTFVRTSVDAVWSAAFQIAEKIKERVFSTDYTVFSVVPLSDYNESIMKPQGSSAEDSTKGRKERCCAELNWGFVERRM